MSAADIDAQLAERYRKAEAADRHDVSATQTIDNRNYLSTPVMLGFLSVIAVFAIGLLIVGIYAGHAVGQSELAIDRSRIAEREARLAQQAAENLRGTMRAHGIKTDRNDDEETDR